MLTCSTARTRAVQATLALWTLLIPATSAQVGQVRTQVDEQRRLANATSTIRLMTSDLAVLGNVDVLLRAESILDTGDGFVARIHTSNSLVTRDVSTSDGWRLRGELRTPGAIAFHMVDRRITVLNPTAFQSETGVWFVRDGVTERERAPVAFRVARASFLVQLDTGRFRLSGELVATDVWANENGAPELADLALGSIEITGDALPPEEAPADPLETPPGFESEPRRESGFAALLPPTPDIIVGNIHDINNYGVTNGIAALALGTTSCNIGTGPADWYAEDNRHPVIGGSLFRLKNGRFEQLGISWLKHGFFAVSGFYCYSDCHSTDGTELGVHCSDPYSANLNGTQFNLGPRFEVNAHTGVFPYPPTQGLYSGPLARRLQVKQTDLDQILNAGAQYFAECQYVTRDDATAGKQNNNTSYRPTQVSGAGTSVFVGLSGTTQREKPAIRAWKTVDPSVVETDIQVPSDGLLILAAKATDLGTGFWSYEYALHNLNCDRSVRSFKVPIDPSATVRNVGFHDVDYHSGEPMSTLDWPSTQTSVSITWSTGEYLQNQWANAIRWGTLYNFRFETDAAPQTSKVTLGLFKPGTPASIEATTVGPITNAADCNANEIPDSIDVSVGTSQDCNGNNIPDECEDYVPGTTRIATGLNRPVYVTSPPADASRLFIVEQGGRIRVLTGGTVLVTPYLDISSLITSDGERGLLSMAFDPQYASNGRFYVNYTNLVGNTVIARYTVSADVNVANAASAVVLKTIVQDFANHNGGQLQFGPDGKLYVGMGDGGSGNDPNNRAQDTGSLLGKMLRLDVNRPPDYIPLDNPFTSSSLPLDEIWAMGFRNPWRFAFDRLTGDLYIGDVGQGQFEEIDFQPASSDGGENYGWRCMEGDACTGLSGCTCNAPTLTLPVHTYPHAAGDCSVTGGYVYRGCTMPLLRGTYFFADYCSGKIRSFRYVNGAATELRDRTAELTPTQGPIGSIVSFGEDAAGELYIVSLAGSIYKMIVNPNPPAVCGNGATENGETCDDGGTQPGDGCDANCQVEPTPHDSCANSLPIGEGSFAYDTSDATTDGPAEPAMCNFSGDTQVGSDLWYCYTPTCTGAATVSTCNSGYNTKIAAYAGCGCPSPGSAIACNDTSCSGDRASVTFAVEACGSYLIRVGGFQDAKGVGELAVTCLGGAIVNDCNGNAIEDSADIACGTSTDGNQNGLPDECESAGNPNLGGRLYDSWFEESGVSPPTTNHPLWSLRPDLLSNSAVGAETWRCKECHGWDYKGVAGQYATGLHRTGFPGIIGSTLSGPSLFTLLREQPSSGRGGGIPNGHGYGAVLPDTRINDLVAFVLGRAIDDADYIGPTGQFLGDPVLGQSGYTSQGSPNCVTCHGANGAAINFGTLQDPEYLGTVANQNPWEMLHKIRFGAAGAPMPSWLSGGGSDQGATDIGRYIQLNFPSECIKDEQCDDGVACTDNVCSADGRCVYPPNDDLCPEDGVFCNGSEDCDAITGCHSAGNPCGGACNEVDQCGCLVPLVTEHGARYLSIIPRTVTPGTLMALQVKPTCPGGSAKYVGLPSGSSNIALLVDNPANAAFRTAAQWGSTVRVTGLDVIPSTAYEIRADCGRTNSPALTAPIVTTTGKWGDTIGASPGSGWTPPNGFVNFQDVAAVVKGFQGSANAGPLYVLDLYGCVPDRIINFIDVSGAVDGFKGKTYQAASLCAQPCP